jgi:peptidoglycan/LPS O-acetylase OafA/YrhL
MVGVDVFFVLSGFLITGMLVRERETSGSISLLSFYARRARRLLPSAIIVLTACAVATALFVPRGLKVEFDREIVASVLYAQNWVLGIFADPAAVDTPMTHFWSLSVEEQFYLLWPVLVIAAAWAARRAGVGIRPVAAVVLSAVVVASFSYSVWLTGDDIRLAYFSTVGRAWEFGVGGLLALAPAVAPRIPAAVRGAVSWAGVAAIAGTMLAPFDHRAFPGWIALLPVAGTLAVIAAGSAQPRWGTAFFANRAPVQWVGGISYSLYLWHWPLIAFAPFVTGVPSQWWFMVLLLALAVALAWATTRFVEARFRAPSASLPPLVPALFRTSRGESAGILRE